MIDEKIQKLDDIINQILNNKKRSLIPDLLNRKNQSNWRTRYTVNLPDEYSAELSFECAVAATKLVNPVRNRNCIDI